MSKKIHYEIWLAIVIVPLFFVITLTGCFNSKKAVQPQFKPEEQEVNEIVIGYIGNLTTPGTNYFGISSKMGTEFAERKINAEGGVMGKKVRVVYLDDQGDKELSKKHIEKLIYEDRALAIIGPTDSSNAFYWLDFLQKEKTPLIINIAAVGELTKKFANTEKNYVFRVGGNDIDNARVEVAYAVSETNNNTKVALIHDTSDYGEQGKKDISEVLARWGKLPVLIQPFDRGESVDNFVEIIKTARDKEANAIIIHTIGDVVINFLKALEEVKGYDPVLVGTSALGADSFWDKGGEMVGKVVFPIPEAARAYLESLRGEDTEIPFYSEIENEYGIIPVPVDAAYAYDTMYFLKSAIEKADSLDKTAIRDALENTEKLTGVTKFFEKPFDHSDHEAYLVKDIYLAHWKDGVLEEAGVLVKDLEIR